MDEVMEYKSNNILPSLLSGLSNVSRELMLPIGLGYIMGYMENGHEYGAEMAKQVTFTLGAFNFGQLYKDFLKG